MTRTQVSGSKMSRRGREVLRSSRDQTGAYGLVLISILLSVLAAVALGRSPWGRWFVAVLQGVTLLLTLNISGAKSRARLTVLAFVIVALTVAAIAVALGNSETGRGIDAVISGLLVVGAPVAIVRGARSHIEITAQTVFAALSVYLLIGLFFAFFFAVMGAIDQPFFASGVNGSLSGLCLFQLRDADHRGVWRPHRPWRCRANGFGPRGHHGAALSRHRCRTARRRSNKPTEIMTREGRFEHPVSDILAAHLD